MKKRVILCCISLIFFLFFINFTTAENITITGKIITDPITGKATVQYASLTVNVISPLNLYLYNPKNLTYINNKILLNYSVSDHQAVWYSLDGSTNITLNNSLIFFNTTNGLHTLRLYSNNTDGSLISRNVSFYINTTKFKINNSKFNSNLSTNLSEYAFEELQNITNLTIQFGSLGKIKFNEVINLSNQNNESGISLDDYINISSNRIHIDSSNLPNLNKPATLTLYGLSFTNPRILKDGSVCSSSECTKESYSAGNLDFNVTGFSTYTSEETPSSGSDSGSSSSSSSSGGGGGGGGGGAGIAYVQPEELEIKPTSLSASLKPGGTTEKSLTITNIGKRTLTLKAKIEKIENLTKLDSEEFTLNPGESKKIKIDFIAKENIKEQLYLGKLIISGSSIKKEILLAIDISSKEALFDVKVDISKKFLNIRPGDELISNVKLFNLGETGRIDATITYEIRDINSITIIRETEVLAVETQTSFTKSLNLPENLQEGSYIMYVLVDYEDKKASSTAVFEVKNSSSITDFGIIIIIVSALAFISICIIFYKIISNEEKDFIKLVRRK